MATAATRSSSSLFMAGSVLAVAGLGLLWSRRSTSTSSREITEIDDLDSDQNGDYLTAPEVAQIFDRLHLEMQQIFAQLMQQMQQLQMMAASGRGQMPSQEELQQIVANELQRTLLIKQKQVLEQFDVDQDCWEEATWEFLEEEDRYPEVKKAVERFQKLWQTATGQRVQGWRPGKTMADENTPADGRPVLTAEQTLKAAETYFETFPKVMRSLMEEYKAQGLDLQNEKVAGKLNIEFSTRANEAGESALEEEHSVSMAQFEASIKAHAGNPSVGRRLAELQQQQQQEMMALTVRA